MNENTIAIPEAVLASARQTLRDINQFVAGAAAALGAVGWTPDLDAGVWRNPNPPNPELKSDA